MNINDRAEVLVQSLPFIQKFNDKIIVVKYGGNAMISEEFQKNVINDIYKNIVNNKLFFFM